MSKRFIHHLCLALLASALLCAGCATNDGGDASLTAAPSSQVSQSTGTVIVTHRLLARAVPADVTHIRYTGKSATGDVHYPATRRPKAATVELSQVPTSVTQLQLELLSNDTLVGQGSVAVSVVANQTVTVQDPTFSDVGLRPQNRLSFAASQRLFMGASTDTASGDFNGDKFADVVSTDSAGKDVQISFGLGNGRFTASQSLPAGAQPQGIAAADVNGDGKLDIVALEFKRYRGSVFLVRIVHNLKFPSPGFFPLHLWDAHGRIRHRSWLYWCGKACHSFRKVGRSTRSCDGG